MFSIVCFVRVLMSSKSLYRAVEDIVLQYTYPRMDSEVSKHRNHLLKSPFCVHPGTGRVCVPVDPARVEEFDPAHVPTVDQLLKELDAFRSQETVNDEDKQTNETTPQHSGTFTLCRQQEE